MLFYNEGGEGEVQGGYVEEGGGVDTVERVLVCELRVRHIAPEFLLNSRLSCVHLHYTLRAQL